MRRTRAFCIGVVAVVSLAAGFAGTNSADAVYYGGPTSAASAPFMVALVDANKPNGYQAQFCGGQYVDTHWVLTAAHCVTLPAGRIQAVSGVTNLSAIKPSDRRKVVQKIVHPNYDSQQFIHDVALLRLAQPVPASWVLPLNTSPNLPASNTTMTVYGWGLTDTGWTDELRSGKRARRAEPERLVRRVPHRVPPRSGSGVRPFARDLRARSVAR
jgi:trypsin